jgi:hypothetical protein
MASRELLVKVLRVCGVGDAELVEQWLQAWRRVRRAPGHRAGPQPYRGMASFQPEDAAWFFGRRALTDQLLARLVDLHTAGGGVHVVVGASGSGKSSLLRAGLIHELHSGRIPGSEKWSVLLFTPGSRPVDELATMLTTLTDTSTSDIAEAIRADPNQCAEYFRQTATAMVEQNAEDPSQADTDNSSASHRRLVLVIDQFEEVLTVCPDQEERRVFIAALCVGAGSLGGVLVVLGLRADFYAQALQYPQLVAAIQANQLTVGPMNAAELREAIVQPASKAKTDIEAGLVDLLLREIAPHNGGRADKERMKPVCCHCCPMRCTPPGAKARASV